MSPGELTALIGTAAGSLVAIIAGLRSLMGDRMKGSVDSSVATVTGWDLMTKRLEAQVQALEQRLDTERKQHFEEAALLREEHVVEMRELREEHAEEIARLTERIDELGSQVYALKHRPPEMRERAGDL